MSDHGNVDALSNRAPSTLSAPAEGITLLLEQISAGDRDATDQLFELVYEKMKRLASRQMKRESTNHTLQSTALVHEAWIKMVGSRAEPVWKNRGHFFAAAAQAMRRILVDAARARQRKKRGGDNQGFEIRDEDVAIRQDEDLLALDEALDQLKENDPLKAELVNMRYFGGFTNKQAAEQLGISTATADRYWVFARAWLRSRVEG
jgi:RNA polymerase sigma factor (TIGR02999 family)